MRKVGGFVEVRYGIHRFAVNLMGYSFSDRGTAVSRYLSEIGETPILSEQEEQELTALLAGKDNEEAVNKLVESNLKFVVKIVAEFRNPDIPFEDLLNEGNIGLIEAARRFDNSRGTRFVSYAVWWIRRAVLLALSRHSDLVRIPSYQVKKVRQLRATERALAGELGRKPNREEISQKLRSTIARVDQLFQVWRTPLSIDDKVGREKDIPISDALVDQGAENPEKRLLQEESQVLIGLALKELSEQERTVIINRFGLEGGRTLTLKEVGERLGITAERVRQIESRATKRMRRLISRNWETHSISKQSPCVAVRRLVGSLHET